MLLGLTFAILASLGSGVGSAVEAFGVRRAAAKGKTGDLGPLLREPVYFIDLTIDLLGFAFARPANQPTRAPCRGGSGSSGRTSPHL